MVEAGACAAVSPRSYYTRKADQVVSYMAKVRLGQTEHGSFVFTVVSPLPPPIQMSFAGHEGEAERPFERRALESLAGAVDALRVAANTALASGSAAPFEQAVPQGVSANLCQAVATLGQINGSRGLELRFAWARSLATSPTTPLTVRLSEDALSVTAQAAAALRERAPRDAVEVQGTVVKLMREGAPGPGMVVVKAVLDDKWRSVQVQLGETDYQRALDAHKAGAAVSLTGELAKDGRMFSLSSPRDFRIIDDP